MANYSPITDFSAKDALTSGDPEKKILGADVDAELNAIAAAIQSKYDSASIASQNEAETGSSNVVLMTPLRTTQWASVNAGIVNKLRALTDPGADRLLFWDESADAPAYLELASGELSLSGTTLSVGSNIAKLSVHDQQFSGRQQFTAPLNAANGGAVNILAESPTLVFRETDAGTNEKVWSWQVAAGIMRLTISNDSTPGTAARIPIQFQRGTGTDALALMRFDAVEFEINATMDFNGNADISGTLTVNNSFTVNSATALIQSANNPAIQVWDTDAGADTGRWAVGRAQGNVLQIGRTLTDNNNGVANGIVMTRSGTSITEVELNAPVLDFNGDADISGTLVLSRADSGFGDNAMLQLVSGAPNVRFYETDAASGGRAWTMGVNSGTWAIRLNNDTGPGTQATGLWVTRSGTSATQAGMAASAIALNGDTTVSGTLNTTGNATVLRLRTAQGSDASLTSTNHPFQIGDTSAENLIMDVNEIQTRLNGAASVLGINLEGGDVQIGHSSSTLIVNGASRAGRVVTSTSTSLTAGQVHHVTGNVTINTATAGQWVGIYNNSGSSITLTEGSGLTLRLAGTSANGNRTLLQRGLCIVYWYANNGAAVSGMGVA